MACKSATSDGIRFEPERVAAERNAAAIGYVIVGGLALGAHRVVRATRDLDLVADPDRENMGRLAAALTAMGGCHPIQDASTGENRARPASTKVRTDHGEVEVLNRMPGIPAFTELVRQRMMLEIQAGVAAPICSLAHLRAMKAAAGRPRDLVDLTELEALHGSG